MTEAAGVSLGIEYDDSAARRMIAALAARATSLGDMLDDIGASQVTETQQRFEDERDPEGKPWEALSTVTLRAKERRGVTTARILRDQSDLYDSLTHQVLPRAVRWGANRTYARIHQLGGQAGRGRRVRIEPRPYLGVSEAGQREIEAITRDHMTGGLR